MSQGTFLFDGTVPENIRYGRFDASVEAVREAARAASAHGFIAEMADGFYATLWRARAGDAHTLAADSVKI
ncbi:P-loop NTPase family protein [Haloarcula laminariae]|uniref:hypothetical protein n=1 Tax=Haloarcula laminariae TaxID=2961577 RepID=UPI002406991A|nr:hypothetical protein [Halomicroarcula sp. FL173]